MFRTINADRSRPLGLLLSLLCWYRAERYGYCLVYGSAQRRDVHSPLFLEVEVEAEGQVAGIEHDTTLTGLASLESRMVGTLVTEETYMCHN